MTDDKDRTSPTIKQTVTPVDVHREQITTADGLTAGWLPSSPIEPAHKWNPGIPGYLGHAPSPQEEVFRLRQELGEQFRRRIAAEQLVDALDELLRLLDPHIQRWLQHKARVAIVAARAAWETTLRGPMEVTGQGEREL